VGWAAKTVVVSGFRNTGSVFTNQGLACLQSQRRNKESEKGYERCGLQCFEDQLSKFVFVFVVVFAVGVVVVVVVDVDIDIDVDVYIDSDSDVAIDMFKTV
jgi:hypothetical protein